jgi:RNA polymerase-binding protein DksA
VAKKASSKKSKSSARKSAEKKASKRKAAGNKSTTKNTRRKAAGKPASRKTSKKAKTSKKTVKRGKVAAAKGRQKKKAAKSKKVTSPLTKTQLKKFRAQLLEKRRDIVGDLNGIEAEAFHRSRLADGGDLSSVPTHPADIGTDNYEQEFSLGLMESERTLLQEIDLALERIENGTFGICLGTGEPIGLPRLTARPWAMYCIDYARKLEKGLVRRDEDREAEIAGLADEDEDEEFEEEFESDEDGRGPAGATEDDEDVED